MLPISTVRVMHRIIQEERHPDWPLWMGLLSLQSAIDPTLWVRRVDVALIGGDPMLLCCRVRHILRTWTGKMPPRIAIIHSGVFPGVPLAALDDAQVREELSNAAGRAFAEQGSAMEIMEHEIGQMQALLAEHGGGGVLAFEMAQGLRDEERGKVVLRLTRALDQPRNRRPHPSASATPLVNASGQGESLDLFQRSDTLWKRGLVLLRKALHPVLESPPEGRRFADLVIADRCELLSGFLSPPGMPGAAPLPGWQENVVSRTYSFARTAPGTVGEALNMWRRDFGLASRDPMSSQDKEN